MTTGIRYLAEFCGTFSGTISDSARLIGADDDVAVSGCIYCEIMAAVSGAAEVYPCSYEYAIAVAANQPFAALQSLPWPSASDNAVVAEGAQLAYLKSFNDIEDDWILTVLKEQDKLTDYFCAK